MMLHLLTHIYYAVQLYRKFEQSRQYRRVLAVTGGVIASVIVAPLLSLLSVGKSNTSCGITFISHCVWFSVKSA